MSKDLKEGRTQRKNELNLKQYAEVNNNFKVKFLD